MLVKIEISPADMGRLQAILTCVMCGVVPDKVDKEKAAILSSVLEDAWKKRESV